MRERLSTCSWLFGAHGDFLYGMPIVIDSSPNVDGDGASLEHRPSVLDSQPQRPPRRGVNLLGKQRKPVRGIGEQASLKVHAKVCSVVELHGRPQLLDKIENRRVVGQIVTNAVHRADHLGVSTIINPCLPWPWVGRIKTTLPIAFAPDECRCFRPGRRSAARASVGLYVGASGHVSQPVVELRLRARYPFRAVFASLGCRCGRGTKFGDRPAGKVLCLCHGHPRLALQRGFVTGAQCASAPAKFTLDPCVQPPIFYILGHVVLRVFGARRQHLVGVCVNRIGMIAINLDCFFYRIKLSCIHLHYSFS